MKKTLLALALLALPAASFASGGIVGDCADCHTMHNSEQGQPVAVSFPNGLAGGSQVGHTFPIQNLLRMDCIACHAQDTTKTVTMSGGSVIPQVYHSDATGDLAGGNFKYVLTNERRGHNVLDLLSADVANSASGATLAPGDIRNNAGGHDFSQFTCAGAKGCHGTRSQAISSTTVALPMPTDPAPANTFYVDNGDGTHNVVIGRVGIAAISGAHHNSFDGLKDPSQIAAGGGAHSGAELAESYRFLRGLKGWGNEAVRWENVDSTSHNEYFGTPGGIGGTFTGCDRCHVPGDAPTGKSARFAQDSSLRIPNQSMSGFCSTCHGNFHSSGGGADLTTAAYGSVAVGANGTSGAFLRHPSDYVIPNEREYMAYTTYDISAPVARQTLAASSDVVTPGSDMVMCLSCHAAHGTEHEGMLRFDYAQLGSAMTAGSYLTIDDAQAAGGCLACHTTKGVLPELR